MSQQTKPRMVDLFLDMYTGILGKLDNCKSHLGYPYLLQVCDELSLDFANLVTVISDVENRCDCSFILNYKTEGQDFINYLDEAIKFSRISSEKFQSNLPYYLYINETWKETRKTKIMFNQFSNGMNYKYPQCCILSFVVDTMNTDIEKEEVEEKSDRERFVFGLKQKLTEEDNDHLRCPECFVKEFGGN